MTLHIHSQAAPHSGRLSTRGLDASISAYIQAIAILITVLGWRSFHLWTQVTRFRGENPITLILESHPWAFRYLAVWPVFTVTEVFDGLDPDTVFTYAGLASTIGLMRLTISMARMMGADSPFLRTKASVYWLAIFVLYLDGRLVLALLGIALILHAQISLMTKPIRGSADYMKLWPVPVGLVLCSVGSGTFAVAATLCALFVFIGTTGSFNLDSRTRRRVALIALAVLAVISPPIIRKNAVFFTEWDLNQLLNHGYGSAFLPIILLCGLAGVALFPLLIAPVDPRRLLIRAGAVSIGAGVFGLSAMATVTVPIGALFAVGFLRRTPRTERSVLSDPPTALSGSAR